MRIPNPRDLYAGVLFMVFGAGFTWLSRDYSMGTLARMGPAYFPTVLGVVLGVLGLLVAARVITAGQAVSPVRLFLKPLLLVLAGTCLFAMLIVPFGLVASIGGLVFLSAVGGPEFRVRDTTVLWIALTLLSVAVFVYGLHLPFKVWPL
jgi:hypothetical protein